MNVLQLTALMELKPYLRKMGKGLLSKRYDISPEDVVRAKHLVKGKFLPKILIFDIETSPMKAYVWKLWKTNINLDHIISEWFCIAWSAKWLYSNEIMGDVLTPDEIRQENDKRLISSLRDLIDLADIVVAHNGNRFDIPRMNARFVIHDLPPTKPYFSIDTCLIAKRQFGFSSNKLDALAGYFNIPHKLETDFSLWEKCLLGEEEALQYMLKYNKMDVAILEEVYLRLRPWIKNHPNIGNLSDNRCACAYCGSMHVELIPEQWYYTSVGKYPLYRCDECSGISRGRKKVNDYPLLTSVGK